uniref:Reverse transcriptase domain-containing protein n=1 Tax=Lactuca sativa TaxID=4236 RepID=A0A9R1VXE0_LACSA|nr:hypothetical protein LSAT_V11C400198280 [Lactuca sativa]
MPKLSFLLRLNGYLNNHERQLMETKLTLLHGILKNNHRKNKIHGLTINGAWNIDPIAIKEEVHNFFSLKFHEPRTNRPKFISGLFKKLSTDKGLFSESNFEVDEIKLAVFDCGSEKASGPDGFTFKLLKSKWETIKDDIIRFVKFFEETGRISKGCNSSFITLVPKTKDLVTLGDYRPIILSGCMYKIITKVLASRLKVVISSIIDETQSTYVDGGNILDMPLIMNETQSWSRWGSESNGDYGFGDASNLLGPRLLLMALPPVNSRYQKESDKSMDIAMKTACSKSIFSRIKLPNNGPLISHLLYADDVIFVGEGSHTNIKNISRILRCFQVSSELKVNFHKSKAIGLCVEKSETRSWAIELECLVESLPFMYLGVLYKLSDQKARHLSFGGRVTLIKAVLGSLPTFYFSLFKASTCVIEELEKLGRNFLWELRIRFYHKKRRWSRDWVAQNKIWHCYVNGLGDYTMNQALYGIQSFVVSII